jgi:hypothetical protein
VIYLDDLLKADDFNLAASSIAKDFRDKYGFPNIHQLGIVVPDVEAAAAELEEKGIGPFFIASSGLKLWRERGQPKSFHGKVGIAYTRDSSSNCWSRAAVPLSTSLVLTRNAEW